MADEPTESTEQDAASTGGVLDGVTVPDEEQAAETTPAESDATTTEAETPTEPAQEQPAEAKEVATKAEPVAPKTAQAPAPEPDESEKELTEALAAVEGDELLTESQKTAQKAVLKAQLRTYQRQRDTDQSIRNEQARIAAERYWNDESKRTGQTAQALQTAFKQAYDGVAGEFPGWSQDQIRAAATIAYRQKLAEMKKPAQESEAAKPKATAKATGFAPKGGSTKKADGGDDSDNAFYRANASAIVSGLID